MFFTHNGNAVPLAGPRNRLRDLVAVAGMLPCRGHLGTDNQYIRTGGHYIDSDCPARFHSLHAVVPAAEIELAGETEALAHELDGWGGHGQREAGRQCVSNVAAPDKRA
jgi:hypothetical protein